MRLDVINVPNGDLPIFIPQEVFDETIGNTEWLESVLGILQDIWDYFLLGLNAIVGLINMVIETILLPFQFVGYLPQVVGSACLVFFAIAIVKAVR